MRTKNGKRIGPVPIALVAVFALAAFLSVGLLLTTGAQPAAAQSDDADCTITIDKAAGDAAGTIDNAATDTTCAAHGDTATVEFVGDVEATADQVLSVLIAEKDGPITAYPNPTTWDGTDTRLEASDGTAASSAKYRFVSVTVPKAAQNAQGVVEAQKTTITVKGNVSVWIGAVSVTSPISGIPAGNAASGAREVAATPSTTLTITFLGVPALGKDLPGDFNAKLDDEILAQCYLATDTANMKVVAEGTDATTCGATQTAVDPNTDAMESRSKLVVISSNGTTPGSPMPLINGMSMDHAMASDHNQATVYAVIEDSKGNALEDVEVTFTVTSQPAGLTGSTRTFDSEVVAGNVVTDHIVATDATAKRTVGNLPTTGSYRVSINVMAGSLNLGTIVLTRPGDTAMLGAGIYDYENCVNTGEDMDSMLDDEFDMEMKDCAMANPARFPRKTGMFAVSATPKDANGTKTGANWMLADIANSDAVTVGRTRPNAHTDAYLLMVKDDAAFGMQTITVTSGTGDKMVTQDLMFYVAGPPVKYTVSPMGTHHTTGSRVIFTVSALDENDGVPHFTTMDDDTTMNVDERNHRVLIDAIYGTLRGVDEDDYLILDTDTGMKTFAFTLPRDARAGEKFEVTVGEGDMAQTVTVVYGEATDPPADELTAPTNVVANSFGTSGTVGVTWKPVAAAAQHIVALMSNDGLTIVDIEYLTAEDNRHTFRDVDPGDYRVIVVAASADGVFMLSKQDMVTVR